MKTLGIIWNVIVNIITVAIVWGIFSIASTNFETIVIAVLVLIYLSMQTFASGLSLSQLKFMEALDAEFRKVKKIIKNDVDREELMKEAQTLDQINNIMTTPLTEKEKEEKEEREKITKVIQKQTTEFYINAVFQVIIYIIALYHILTALSVL